MDEDMDLLAALERVVEDEQLLPRHAPVTLGVSGGIDSMVLLSALDALGYSVIAVHINHQLRPAAKEDQRFVEQQSRALNVPFCTRVIDPASYAEAAGTSLQDAARTLRYEALVHVAHEQGSRHVAVAHHLDDQVETLLLQLFRGSGPEGLSGMSPRRPLGEAGVLLVRPLLSFRRARIEDYARERALAWREDATNVQTKYRRNALRCEILPLIEEHFGRQAMPNIARSSALLRDYLESSWQDELERRLSACCGADRVLELGPLRRQPEVWQGRVLMEALRRWLPDVSAGRGLIGEIRKLLEAQPGRRVALPGGTIWRERSALVYVPDVEAGGAVPDEGSLRVGEALRLRQGCFTASYLEAWPADLSEGAPWTVFADAARLAPPLQVRPWRTGDAFTPLGMEHTKKVSDLLTDAKIPSHARGDVAVVCDQQQIIWVAGVRPSNRVRVTGETCKVLKLSLRGGPLVSTREKVSL